MTYIETTILTFFDIIQYYLILNRLVNAKIIVKKFHLILVGITILVNSSLSYYIDEEYTYFLTSLVLLIFNYIAYKNIVIRNLFWHIISVIIVLFVQMLSFIPLNIFINDINYEFNIGICGQLISLILVVIIVKIIPIHVVNNFIKEKFNTYILFSLNLFIILSALVINWYLEFESLFDNLIAIILMCSVVAITNYLHIKDGLKNIQLKDQINIYDQYLPIIDELVEELRAKQHDFDNQITSIKMMIQLIKNSDDDIDKVETYLSEITKDYILSDLIKLNNKVLVAFLYAKYTFAKKNNIQFEVNIQDYDFRTKINDYVLIEILSILVSNAFETDIENNSVIVDIDKIENKSVVKIANKHPYIEVNKIKALFEKGYSSKSEKGRGLGLFKLKQILEYNSIDIVVNNQTLDGNYIFFELFFP